MRCSNASTLSKASCMCEAPGIGLPPAAGDPARPSPHAVFYLRQCRQENVEVMLANIDKTEVLENKSAALADQAKTFHKTARATRKHMCRQNAKMNLIICCVCGARSPATLLPVCPHRSQQFLNRGCSHLLRVLLVVCVHAVLLLTVILVPTLMHFIPMSGNPASPSPSPPSPSPPPSASPSPLPPPS